MASTERIGQDPPRFETFFPIKVSARRQIELRNRVGIYRRITAVVASKCRTCEPAGLSSLSLHFKVDKGAEQYYCEPHERWRTSYSADEQIAQIMQITDHIEHTGHGGHISAGYTD